MRNWIIASFSIIGVVAVAMVLYGSIESDDRLMIVGLIVFLVASAAIVIYGEERSD